MIPPRFRLLGAALLGFVPAVNVLSAQSEKGPVNQYGNPMKIVPRATTGDINEKDLRTRLYIFADDSMAGRAAGTLGNQKGTDYIAAEVKRLGLEPAGDNGTYFQSLPYGMRYYGSESQLSAGSQQLRWGTDFVGGQGAAVNTAFQNVQVIYGGIAGDTAQEIAPSLAIGRFVILIPDPNAPVGGRGGGRGQGGGGAGRGAGAGGAAGRGGGRGLDSAVSALAAAAGRGAGRGAGAGGGGGRGGGRGGGFGPPPRFAGAAGVATVDLDGLTPAQSAALGKPPARSTQQQPAVTLAAPTPGSALGPLPAPPSFRLTRAAAEQLMGVPLAGLPLAAAGRMTSGKLVVVERMTPTYARNVVAILRGSDPSLKDEYVAIGAHNDHNPNNPTPVDHDSLHAVRTALYSAQMSDGKTIRALSAEARDSALATINWAEVRKSGTARMDSVNNGADDDGSGSMAVLEIAEALASARVKPKRSVIFVWHAAEEVNLGGSAYFTNNPTVPINSIVAQINIDMIGRGRADDLPGGGPDYLAVVGSKRLSTDLGNMVVAANKQQKKPLKLDYEFDDSTSWSGYNNIYGRSDHANYARKGIPIAFFFTGLHRDYHQLTDEPQYIDYPHYARIANYIRDLLVNVGNAPHRPVVDKTGAQ